MLGQLQNCRKTPYCCKAVTMYLFMSLKKATVAHILLARVVAEHHESMNVGVNTIRFRLAIPEPVSQTRRFVQLYAPWMWIYVFRTNANLRLSLRVFRHMAIWHHNGATMRTFSHSAECWLAHAHNIIHTYILELGFMLPSCFVENYVGPRQHFVWKKYRSW